MIARAAVVAVLLAAPLAAQDPAPSELVLIQGRSASVTEDKEIKRVAVGDPNLVDVVLINPKEILLNAKKPGRTNLIVWYGDDTGRRERTVHVEHDLSMLRDLLKAVDPSLTAVTASDGQSVVIQGGVADEPTRAGLLSAAQRLLGSAPEPAKPGEKPTPTTGPRLVFLVGARTPLPGLESQIVEALKPFGADLKVRRLPAGASADDAKDTFILEGVVETQTAYTQALIVLDRMLGGPGSDFKVVANEGGGLHTAPTTPAATPQPTVNPAAIAVQPGGTTSTLSQGTLQPSNLSSNIARAVAVKGKTDRWLSFVRVRTVPQVLISVRVLSLDKSKTRDIGISFDQLLQTTGSVTYSRMNTDTERTFTLTKDGFLLTDIVRALESKGYVKTLSEPNLMALNGETATFLVGGEVPISEVVATTATAVQSTSFREFGIRLTIRPVVSEDGRTVTVDVQPEISEVQRLEGANANTPPGFRRTMLRTSAQLKDGEGLVLGGLITTTEEDAHEQIPGLGDIPVIGAIFGRTVTRKVEREIGFVLLPRIVYPRPATAFALDLPSEDFEIRGGVFHDPDLGTLKTVPDFFRKNVSEGERVPPGQPK